jgi:hypothetical protein
MRYTQLAVVKHRIAIGAPLPFNVYNSDKTLLLALGKTIDSHEQLEALFTRGTLVDLAELHRGVDAVMQAPPELLPALWADNFDRLGRTLRRASSANFRAALDEAAEPVVALIERDPDLAIFQVLSQNPDANTQYGLNHSIHTGIVARLVTQRLGWDAASMTRAFKAALTMNISMLELQGVLATQDHPPSDEQRRAIHTHPVRSREMLVLAGVTDAEWLRAVEQHHEESKTAAATREACQRPVSDLASLAAPRRRLLRQAERRAAQPRRAGRRRAPVAPNVHAATPANPDDGRAGEGIRHLPAGLRRARWPRARPASWSSAVPSR